MSSEPIAAEPPMDRSPVLQNRVNIVELWSKYEDIAMHFNDLLMRLRSQGLAGIAAVSTLVGVFAKEGGADIHTDWIIATGMFFAIAWFWVAIWFVDIFYYNRLLTGSVKALVELEAQSTASAIIEIKMSRMIEEEFSLPVKLGRFRGIHTFYGIVLAVIVTGFFFGWHMLALNP